MEWTPMWSLGFTRTEKYFNDNKSLERVFGRYAGDSNGAVFKFKQY